MIQLDQVSKHFSDKTILDSVTFQFPLKKRIALIGANGAGKTTLLNLLCGLDEPDDGRILVQGQIQIGYLPQEPNSNPRDSVLAEAQSGNEELFKLKLDIEDSLNNLEEKYSAEELKRHEILETEFRRLGGYALEAKAQAVLSGLGFSEESLRQSPKNLSGGWRMRLELAKIFLNEPNVLILDEPTNHLDLPSLVWVENYLKSFQGTLIFVSHDKALLNRLADYTVLLINGQLESYPCSFDKALELRASRLELDEARLENLVKKRQKMEEFVDRFGAKATKAKQAQSRVKMIDKLRSLESGIHTETDSPTVSFTLPSPNKSGRDVLSLNNITVGYSANAPLVKNLSIKIERGQKVAIIGANGIGKSTLLKTIIGNIDCLSGEITYGHNVSPAYYSQSHDEALALDQDCLSNILSMSDRIGERDARALLGAFLFTGDDVFKPTKVLSGGEKARVSLAKILVQNANFLLLDEPTNHLDMSSVEALSTAIGQFEGTVLFVSHDRTFIDSICSHVLVILPSGRSMLFEGNLDDYQRMAEKSSFPNVLDPDHSVSAKEEGKKVETIEKSEQKTSQLEIKELKRQRNSFQKKIKSLEMQELQLKAVQNQIEAKMAAMDPSEYEDIAKLQGELSQATEDLETCEMVWLETSESLETIEAELARQNRG